MTRNSCTSYLQTDSLFGTKHIKNVIQHGMRHLFAKTRHLQKAQSVREWNHGRLVLRHETHVKDDNVKTYVPSASYDINAVDRQGVLWGSYFKIVPSHELSQLSFHSCNYGFFIGCWPCSPCTTYIHNCRRCHNSCLTETLLQSSKDISVWVTATRRT